LDKVHAGTLQDAGPSEVKEFDAGFAAAHAEGSASLAEDHGASVAMTGGGPAPSSPPSASIALGITVLSGGGAFLAGCGVLYNTDISSSGSFIVSTTSFVRQVYYSIATTTFYAMCAYGEA
jgi:hypothetical protein